MAGKESTDLSARTEKVRRRFESWRRRHKGRLPERLWSSAVDLAREQGVSPVARALRLDYNRLKHRLEVSQPSGSPPRVEPSHPPFIEIGLPTVRESPPCIVTIEDGSGVCLTVQVPTGCASELAGVVKALWTYRP
jgi:hypothetical protein